MTKQELAEKIAAKTNLSKKSAEEAAVAFIDSVIEAVVAGDNVQLIGFGTFTSKDRPARNGRNPRTGETVKIAAAKVPVFKPGKGFKEALNVKKGKKK